MNKRDFYSLVKAVPKAELHLHGEAVISNKTIKKLYNTKTGQELSDEELHSLFDYEDLGGFLASFIKIQNYFSTLDNITYIFNDFNAYLKKNNIVYCETFFSPTSLLRNGFTFSELVQRIQKATIRSKEKLGTTVKILVDVSRSFGLENAQKNLSLVLQEHNPCIIGIGFGGDEAKGPAKDYAPVFLEAEKAGLHRVIHAGETVESWSMKDAIYACHAERIGHGISAMYDPDFVSELARTQIPLEVCPTSNLFTKHYVKTYAEHPLKRLFDAGVLVTVNTDDPTFFKASLLDEYWNAYHHFGFTLPQIKTLIKNAFTAAFLSQAEKQQYYTQVDEAWASWFATHPGRTEN